MQIISVVNKYTFRPQHYGMPSIARDHGVGVNLNPVERSDNRVLGSKDPGEKGEQYN